MKKDLFLILLAFLLMNMQAACSPRPAKLRGSQHNAFAERK